MQNKSERPASYPHPTETDKQLKNQPEYIDQQPNDFNDKSISDIPVSDAARQSNDPMREKGQES
jgi:hypothetical protein